MPNSWAARSWSNWRSCSTRRAVRGSTAAGEWRKLHRRPRPASRDAVGLEPGEHVFPAIGRSFGIVARPVIGIEAVLGIGIDDELILELVFGDLGLHCRDVVLGDALVEPAIEAEHWHLDGIDDI